MPDPRFPGEIADDRLSLMFACCHPALARLAVVGDGLDRHHLRHAVEGDLRLRAGDRAGAAACFVRALDRAGSEPERRFLRGRIATAQA